jgi:amidase
MSDLHELTALEQVAALASRELSSRELTEHYLRRIGEHDQELRSFTTVFPESALAAADLADDGPVRGPLHGLPLGLKDLHPTAGLRTTMGSAALIEWLPPVDAPVVGALRAAGAVVLGKTSAPELGPTCYTESKVAGVTRSPYGVDRSPSGSSGGAAASVAAGLQPLGHASDGLGSIRTPAAACGLVGHKPSRGRFAGSGGDWLALAVEGPVARTVADAALFLDVLPRPGAGVLWHGPPWHDGAHLAATRRRVTGLRVGVHVDPGMDVVVDAACLEAVRAAADALAEDGHEVVEVPVGTMPRIDALRDPLVDSMAGRIGHAVDVLVPEDRRHLLMPLTAWLAARGAVLPAIASARAQTVLAAAGCAWAGAQAQYDLLLTPTTTTPPVQTGALRRDDGDESLTAMLGYSAFTPWANLTGAPAISLPVAVTEDGQPVGVQLLAGVGRDELLLSLAAVLEERFCWQTRHPVLW